MREYRANNAPFTTSGRFVNANTGPSRFVKWRSRVRRSSAVNVSGAYQIVTPSALTSPSVPWATRLPR